MGLGEDLQRESAVILRRVDRFVDAVQDEAYAELERRLQERLPEVSPIDSGALARSYTFDVRDGKLFVENSAFYWQAIKRHGHDLDATILEEADSIVRSAEFSRLVLQRAFLRAPV